MQDVVNATLEYKQSARRREDELQTYMGGAERLRPKSRPNNACSIHNFVLDSISLTDWHESAELYPDLPVVVTFPLSFSISACEK